MMQLLYDAVEELHGAVKTLNGADSETSNGWYSGMVAPIYSIGILIENLRIIRRSVTE